MDNSSIKENIRKVRKAKNLTQEEIANRLDISLTAYRDLEKGSTSIMNTKVIRLAELLGTSTEELVLGYLPAQNQGRSLEELRSEYGGQIDVLKHRIEELENTVEYLKEIVNTKNEIIALLKNKENGETH